MADDVIVKHPTIENVVQKVPSDKVKDWTDSGWERVKRADEEAVIADLPLPPVA